MVMTRQKIRFSGSHGQSLIETALLIPLLLLIIFNVINFAFYFLVAIHLASSPREGAQYSIMGFATPGTLSLPQPGAADSSGSVAFLAYKDMASLITSTTIAQVRVCTSATGTTVVNGITTANCYYCDSSTSSCSAGSGPFATPAVDPEPTAFILHRVDVRYTVTPLINAAPFGIQVLPSYVFYRQVSMRAMN